MKKIISFSVWGDNPKYLNGCIENIKEAREIYPDWIPRFYCDSRIPESFLALLKDNGAEVIVKEVIESDWEGLFWRFLPASEPDVSIFISRDIDSRVNAREKAAVDEWVNSHSLLHSMRDHVEHNVPILGGMWGCRNGLIIDINLEISNWQKKNCKGSDQDFLQQNVWNKYKHLAMVHDKFYNGLVVMEGIYKPGCISTYDFENPDPYEIAPDYVYDPIKFFGEHDIRPFPPHEPLKYGVHVGEIIGDN